MHVQAMSEQRQKAAVAMADSLRNELAERGTMIAHLQEELQQKEHLLQQISVAAAPAAAATLPVARSPKRLTPNKMARIPCHTPGRIVEDTRTMQFMQQPALVRVFGPPAVLQPQGTYYTILCDAVDSLLRDCVSIRANCRVSRATVTSLVAPPRMQRQTWRLPSKQCQLLQATSMAPFPD